MNEVSSEKYEFAKREVLSQLDDVLITSSGVNVEKALDIWAGFSKAKFFEYLHKFDPAAIYPSIFEDDDERGEFELDLYDSEYLYKARKEKDVEGLGGKNSFIIGGVNGADELVFVTKELDRGVSIMHHDNVFLAKDLDTSIEKNISYLKCPILKLFQALERRDF